MTVEELYTKITARRAEMNAEVNALRGKSHDNEPSQKRETMYEAIDYLEGQIAFSDEVLALMA